jgi:large subunit ribosomal protein L9
MKIILNQAIDSLGNEGEILDVKAGYARNYLIPKGWAKQATQINIAATQKEIEAKQKKEAKTRDNLEALGKILDKLSLKFELKAGEEGRLFGSVTSQMIVDAIAEKGYTVKKKEIEMEESINHVGKYFVDVKLGHGFVGRVKIKVAEEK